MYTQSILGASILLLGLCTGAEAELRVKAVATCGSRSFAVASDGTVWEWGSDGAQQSGPAPVRVAGLSGIVAVAAGNAGNLALRDDGAVWAWGSGWNGREQFQYAAPVQLTGLEGIVAVAAGYSHMLALKNDGTVWAWGDNLSGELGDGTTTSRAIPAQVSGMTGVRAIGAGSLYSLALKTDGTVWAWGSNSVGQLGDGTTAGHSTPVAVTGLTGVAQIAANYPHHNLALKGDGTIWEWGFDLMYPSTPRLTPVQVSGIGGVVALGEGGLHHLALRGDGTVWAWGMNWNGQLGDGTTADRSTPVQVIGLTAVTAVAAGTTALHGASNSLALKSDGTVWAWGGNHLGQLGDGTTAYQTTRVAVSGIDEVVAVAGGAWHSLALKKDGTVWVWGRTPGTQLGDGTTTTESTPIQVSGLDGIRAISAGAVHSLALREDGTVWAWGANSDGQLGDGTFTLQTTPVQVSGLSEVAAIAAGAYHNLAVKKDGTVWAWGSNAAGQLGDGGTLRTAGRPTAAQVSGISDVVVVAADWNHSLALKSDGTVWAWGFTSSNNDAAKSYLTPAEVSGLKGVVAAGWGLGRGIAAKNDGTVWEWAIPEEGSQSPPVQVSGLTGVVALAGGAGLLEGGHCLALKSDRTVWSWGVDDFGQLGLGDSQSFARGGATVDWPGRAVPAQVAGLVGVASIAAGTLHSLAVKGDGIVWAWGANNSGQLGYRPGAYQPIPVQVIQPGSPDLAITLSHDGEFVVGGQGVYTLTITNVGATTATGDVTVTGILPPGLSYSSAAGGGWSCSAEDQIFTCTNSGPTEPGGSNVITLTVELDAAAWPGITNFAKIDSASDRNSSNNAMGDPTVVRQP